MKNIYAVTLGLLLSLPAMASSHDLCAGWSNHNLSHVNTWAYLRVFKQFREVFGAAEEIRVNSLPMAQNNGDAYMLADMLDKAFTSLGSIKVENARQALYEGLINATDDTSLKDYADQVVGKNYKFKDDSCND